MGLEINRIPTVGEAAPSFTLPSSTGQEISLSDYQSQRAVVLYFYPKDDTPGCTREACGFRDIFAEIQNRGAEVLGVSPDSIAAHGRFIKKYSLTFPLLSDTDHAVATLYGVWGKKKFMGREYMGINRTTFVIDKEGTIRSVFPNVKVQNHATEVLKALP